MAKNNNKNNSVYLIIIVFVLLFGYIIFLPNIKFNKVNTFKGNIENKNNEDIDNTVSESDFYELTYKDNITFNNVTFNIVSFDNNILTLNISNTDEDILNKNYYIEFYKDKKVFIARRVFKGNKGDTVTIDLSNLNIDNTYYISIRHIDDVAIPKDKNINDNTTYVCSNNDIKYSYTFINGKLSKTIINESFKSDNLDILASKKLEIKKKLDNLSVIDGINADMVYDQGTIITTIEVDYDKYVSTNDIGYKFLFSKDYDINVLKFKMDAEGFDCNE